MMRRDLEPNPLDLIAAHHEQRRREINERYKRSKYRLLWYFMVATLMWIAVDYTFAQFPNPPSGALVAISDVQPSHPPALCPGDTLEYVYNIDGAQDGVVDINVTVYRETPPARTVVYSTPLHDILVDPVHQKIYAVWTIPHEVIDPFTGEAIPFTPGAYERRIAISTSSRNTQPVIASVKFFIREDCK